MPADGLPPDRVHASGASLDGITATGMLSLAVWEIVGRDLAVAEIVDSQIDVVGRQLLGLTLSCARCHDHKFDPISTEDYYGLAGIFFSSHIATGKLIADGRLANELTEVPLLNAADDRSIAGSMTNIAAADEPQIAALGRRSSRRRREADGDRRAVAGPGRRSIEQVDAATAKKKPDRSKSDSCKTEQEELVADQLKHGWRSSPAGTDRDRRAVDSRSPQLRARSVRR